MPTHEREDEALQVLVPAQASYTEPPLPSRPDVRAHAPYGNMALRCGGCCVTPSDAWHAYVVGFFAVAPTAVFVTSVVSDPLSIALALSACVLTVATLVLAVTCDPGIVPPADVTGDWHDVNEISRISVNGVSQTATVCTTCRVVRPPKSGHCRFCDTCVEEYDHHCGVLGACVGRRTFRFFALFMHCATALCAIVLVRSIMVAASTDLDAAMRRDALSRWRAVATIGCIVVSLLIGCMVVGPAFGYIAMACRETTTKELHKAAVDRRVQQSIEREQRSVGCRACLMRFFGPVRAPGMAAYPV
jgi:hypothetical protein